MLLVLATLWTSHVAIAQSTSLPLSNNNASTMHTIVDTTTVKHLIEPKELNFSKVLLTHNYCPFGFAFSPLRNCSYQTDCQSDFNLNAYCSPKGKCCQEGPNENTSLCFDKRLPIFGEDRCSVESDCKNNGALCKSERCCPNFQYAAGEFLKPPTHFYKSNYPCTPGEPIPPGFHFAFCSTASKTIAYLGTVNKCGRVQHISLYYNCESDADCSEGSVCVRIVNEKMCFRNPENCKKRNYYWIAKYSFYAAFLFMICYFLTRACYENPKQISDMFPILALQLYRTTKDAEDKAYKLYGKPGMPREDIELILMTASKRAWKEEEASANRPALEYLLNYCGYVIDHSEYEESDEDL